MVLVDRKTDGFQDEISPDIKKEVKTNSLIPVYPISILGKFLDIKTNFILEPVSFSVIKYHLSVNVLKENIWMVLRSTSRLNITIYPDLLHNSHILKQQARGRKGKHETQVN